MSKQQLPAEIWNHLKMATERMAADDYEGCSHQLWLAARAAAVIATLRRNWPADTDEELRAAMKRLDREYDDQQAILAGFLGAQMYEENAKYRFLEKDDVIAFQVALHQYIDQMLALEAPMQCENDVERL